jgi:hypothetical protein
MQSADERITEEFLRWSFRGQGFHVFVDPVSPEPAFMPYRRALPPADPANDDGRKPTALSSFLRGLGNRLAPPAPAEEAEEMRESEPRRLVRSDLTELQIFAPADQSFRKEDYECFLAGISTCAEPVAFEILSDEGGVSAQFTANPTDLPYLRGQLEAFFPDSVFVEREGALRRSWDKAGGDYFAVVEFGLEREFVLPVRAAKLDLYVGLVALLGGLREGEMGVFQVIVEPVRHPWAEHALRSVTDGGRKALFDNAPELFSGAKEKVSVPLYAAVVRAAFRGDDCDRIEELVTGIAGTLRAFESEGGNRFVLLGNDEYPSDEHAEDMLLRQSRRSGMILNAHELAALVHLPSRDIRSQKLVRHDRPTRQAPAIATSEKGVLLGHNLHAGISTPVRLNPEQRLRHMHIIGASGTGKSTLLFNLVRHDIENGGGVAVLDPHGDLVDRILGVMPPERIKDVVLLDPSYAEYPVGFNILHAHSELEKTLLASDLVSVFQRLSTSWGDQMGSVLSHAVLAFLESDRGGSLLDLRRFLLEPAFRAAFLESVRDPEVVYYWQKGFSQLTGGKSVGPILTRLETFLTPKSIRCMVGQRENRLDFADILDTGKIFLAKLSQGAIGKENSYLLGTLLVSKFQQLAMARQGQAERDRRDYFLYVDEFHNFMTPSMAEILAGARKYRLGMVMAHQELRQLERDREVSSAVMGNAYSRISFRVGDADARALETGFSHFEAKDLQNLGTGEAICRVERSDFDFNLKVILPTLPEDAEASKRRQEVIAASRSAYGRPRAEVEAVLGLTREERAAAPPPARLVTTSPEKPTQITPAPAKPTALPIILPPPSTPGRGGKEHKYLQTFIKQWAEGMGWRTAIEAPVPGGSGSVDVLLSKGEVTVACEISVTTSPAHEVENLEKCLNGGFTHVVSVSADRKRVREIEEKAKAVIPEELRGQLRYATVEELFEFVTGLNAGMAETTKTVKGYKVKVSYRSLSLDEQAARTGSVASVIARSLRRLKEKR